MSERIAIAVSGDFLLLLRDGGTAGVIRADEADQWLEALAARLGRDVAPRGWFPTYYTGPNGGTVGWHATFDGEFWEAGRNGCRVGLFATAADAAAAVERLSEEQRSGGG